MASCRCCWTCSIRGASSDRLPRVTSPTSSGAEALGQVAIEHGPHAGREFELARNLVGDETHHEDGLVANLHPPDGERLQRRSVRKVLLPEKGGGDGASPEANSL